MRQRLRCGRRPNEWEFKIGACALLCVIILWNVAWAGNNPAHADSPFAFHVDPEKGELTLLERGTPVFSYVYQARLADGVEERFRREAYIHPLFDVAGQPITMEFPGDHPHHRGVWFSWPWMQVREREVELWHPSPLRHRFNRWEKQEVREDCALLSVSVDWVLDGEVVVGREQWDITVFPAKDHARLIDLVITAEALDQPISVRGQRQRGYGGLTVRASADLRHGRLDSDKGELPGDSTNEHFEWASVSNPERLIAVFAHPDNPKAPQTWLIRHGYGGILNPQWPGTEVGILDPGAPLRLRYALFVHQGQPDREDVDAAYRIWADGGHATP